MRDISHTGIDPVMGERDANGLRVYRDSQGQIIERGLTEAEIREIRERRAKAWDRLYAEARGIREPEWQQASFDQADPEAMNARMILEEAV